MSSQAKQSNTSLDLSGKTAVVTGATQGIGECVAMRFAQLGASRIFIVGRNERKGNAVLERLKDAAAARSSPTLNPHFEFLRADLSMIKTAVVTANRLKQMAEKEKIDYLVLSHGGPPNGVYEENSEGYDKSLVVNCLSRFGLTYLLAQNKALNEGGSVVSILSPGSDCPDLDLEDLSLKNLNATQPWRIKMLMSQAKTCSALTDAFTMEFNHRYPSTKFYHVFPGLVTTSALANSGFPFPLPQLSALFAPILSRTIASTPMSYSDIPIYLAANPAAKKLHGFFYNEQLKKVELGSWAKNSANQQKAFEKLRSLFVTEAQKN